MDSGLLLAGNNLTWNVLEDGWNFFTTCLFVTWNVLEMCALTSRVQSVLTLLVLFACCFPFSANFTFLVKAALLTSLWVCTFSLVSMLTSGHVFYFGF